MVELELETHLQGGQQLKFFFNSFSLFRGPHGACSSHMCFRDLASDLCTVYKYFQDTCFALSIVAFLPYHLPWNLSILQESKTVDFFIWASWHGMVWVPAQLGNGWKTQPRAQPSTVESFCFWLPSSAFRGVVGFLFCFCPEFMVFMCVELFFSSSYSAMIRSKISGLFVMHELYIYSSGRAVLPWAFWGTYFKTWVTWQAV